MNEQSPPASINTEFQPIISANYSGKKRGQVIVFIEFTLTVIILYYTNRPYYSFMINHQPWMLLMLPLSIYGLVWEFCIFTLILSWIAYRILCLIESPKEGEFSIHGKEFNYYLYRFWVCYYALYVARAMPLPWVDMFFFRAFGSKIGHNIVLYDSWIDPEFVEIQDSCMISLNTQLISHCMYKEKFIVKKITIQKNAIVGACAIVAPGTFIEEGAVLGANCSTQFNQRLGAYRIHVGAPASISLPIKLEEKRDKKIEFKDKSPQDTPINKNLSSGEPTDE